MLFVLLMVSADPLLLKNDTDDMAPTTQDIFEVASYKPAFVYFALFLFM